MAPPQAPKAKSTARFELLKNDTFGVSFGYDRSLVAAIKRLASRRWNPSKKRWEIHLSHLTEVLDMFGLDREAAGAEVLDRFDKVWGGSRVKVLLGPLHGALTGARFPLAQIDEACSFLVPGHQFSPKFKQKQWDGKRHLFNARSFRFPSGLWPRVQKVLVRSGAKYDLEIEPAPTSSAVEYPTPRTPLRDYQARALESAVEKKRGIVQIATGGGKTLLAAHLIARLGLRTFFFVHTRELLHQTADVFASEFGIEIGRLGDGLIDFQDITVATLQTAARVFGVTVPRTSSTEGGEARAKEKSVRIGAKRDAIKKAIEEAGLVIFDECHHVPADTAYKIAFHAVGASNRFGLSATPWRDDHHDLLLEAALGAKVCEVASSDLIKQEYLVPPRIAMEAARSPGGLSRRLGYPEVYRLAIVENQSRNRAIAARARQWAEEGLSVLILVAQIEHGKRLVKALPEARFAYGSLDMDTRRRYVADLERKLHLILIATTLADEGLDIPSLDAVILAGGGKSATKAYQRIGRALRPAPNKSEARIMDFLDQAPFLNEHSLARLELYRNEPAFDVRTPEFAI